MVKLSRNFRRLTRPLIVLVISFISLSGDIGGAAAQQPAASRRSSTQPQAARTTDNINTTLKDFADLLKTEAERSEQAAKGELDTITRTLERFGSVITLVGSVVTALSLLVAAVLTFFGVSTARGINRRLGDARVRVDEAIKEMNSMSSSGNIVITEAKAVTTQAEAISKEALSIITDAKKRYFGAYG